MKTVKILDKSFKPMIPHHEIEHIVADVASKVNAYYSQRPQTPVLLVTLNGALPFSAELMKHLEFDPMIASIKVSSYEGTQTTGSIKTLLGPTMDLKGRDVLILEDIVDTGITMTGLRKLLDEMGAEDVKMCTMLFKPEKFHDQEKKSGIKMMAPEFVGKEIPNSFILGFGLDYDELGRCLQDIYVLDE